MGHKVMSNPRTESGQAISELILTIFRLNGRLLAAGDRLVAPLGLTSARWQVLGSIALSPSPEPVARLARNMGLNRQGVQRIVNELADDGFVEYKTNPHHRNARLVLLTPKGRSAYDAALAAQAPWVNSLGVDLDQNDIHHARHLLEKLKSNIEANIHDDEK